MNEPRDIFREISELQTVVTCLTLVSAVLSVCVFFLFTSSL